MMALTSKGMDHEEALTAMADVLASHIARSDETGTGFDVNAYAADLLALS
jgi:hypothetical protein